MKINFNTLSWTAIILILISQPSLAFDWRETNKAVIEKFAIPHFEQLLDASKQLQRQTELFCKKADDEALEEMRKKFHQMMDAWQSIQMLRTGPEEKDMRSFRIQMWPTRSNSVAKQMRKLLADKNPEVLKPEVFRKSSTAVQGLPAFERFLFAKGVKASDFQEDGNVNYQCQLLQAIAFNLNAISTDLLKEWQTTYKEILIKPNEKSEIFISDKEVASAFFKDMATELQAVYERKVKVPKKNKPIRLANLESWRSERSLRNITLNLESIEEIFNLGFAPHLKNEALKRRVHDEFQEAIETSKMFNMSLKKLYKEKPKQLTRWVGRIIFLRRKVVVLVPRSLGVQLGFNSLDGD